MHNMKKILTLFFSFFLVYQASANMILTGVVDGPLSGGTKMVEVYVYADIADLSLYGLGFANNGGGTDGQEYTFPADAVTAGTFLYIANNADNFNNYFGFAADYIDSSLGGFNGDDAIEVYENGAVIDIFGDVDVDGTGTPWDHLDSWAYRVDNTGPDGSTFVLANWTVQAVDLLDNTTTNAEAMPPFPLGTYMYAAPTNPVVSFSGANISVNESTGTTDVTVSITAEDGNDTSVDIVVDPSSTADAMDYSLSNATVTFPANDNMSQVVTVTINDDMDQELQETIVLTLANPTNNATLGGNSTYTITISDNDTPIPNLVINEINYNVPSTDSLEFIEIYNNDVMAVDLNGFSFQNAISFDFVVSTVINPGEYLVLCNDAAAFMNAFGITAIDWGGTQGLNNTGETIELYDAAGNLVDELTYDDGTDFPSAADGQGPSLELCDPNEDNNDPNNWFASTNPTGVVTASGEVLATPGAANSVTCLAFIAPQVTFLDPNPFETNLTPEDAGTLTFEVAIEDGNEMPTNVTVDVISSTATAGSDFDFTPITLTFPANVEDDTLTFTVDITDDMDPELIEDIVFGLSMNDNMSELVDSVMVVEIADNDSPVAELVITEIMYNTPSDDTLEFIEILNNGATTIDLSGARFLDGVFHVFADGSSLDAGAYMVLCVDSTAFMNAFGISAIQWDAGGLSNNGEDISLYDASGNLADYVDYNDAGDFPTEPDGFGPSLELCDPNEDNNDPFFWFASIDSTGVMIDSVEIVATPGMMNSVTCLSTADPVVTFTDESNTVMEDVGSAFVGVEITNGNANDTEVTFTIDVASTATDGSDYTLSSTTITFPAGTTSDITSLEIPIIDDMDTEVDETIIITISADNNAQLGAITTHTITIEDNDPNSNQDVFAGLVNIFPNPVSDQLNIQSDIRLDRIRIVNVVGQTIHQMNNLNGNVQIPMNQLPQGLYFVELTSGEDAATYQIIVE